MFKNSKIQGDWGLGVAIAYFTRLGCTVCIPLTDSQDYDLIVELNNELKKIQIKSTTYTAPSGSYAVSLVGKGGNRSRTTYKKLNKEKVDYIFIVTEKDNKYLIPSKIVNSTITLGKKYNEYLLK